MKTAWHLLGSQLARPHGVAGRLTGLLMRRLNREPYRLAIGALQLRKDSRVLELGFGPGEGLAELLHQAKLGQVHGIDVSETMFVQASMRNAGAISTGRIVLRLGDFAQLPYPDATFDRVLAVNVAYFWTDPAAMAAEIRRVLRPTGRVSLYVTERSSMEKWPFADRRTHRLFDAQDLSAMFTAAGFDDDAVRIRAVAPARGVGGLVATGTA